MRCGRSAQSTVEWRRWSSGYDASLPFSDMRTGGGPGSNPGRRTFFLVFDVFHV